MWIIVSKSDSRRIGATENSALIPKAVHVSRKSLATATISPEAHPSQLPHDLLCVRPPAGVRLASSRLTLPHWCNCQRSTSNLVQIEPKPVDGWDRQRTWRCWRLG
eukprot:scaffold75006_cov36-Tisochrysis_lutea.AAC.9